MGWVADSADLAMALAKWARERMQSGAWEKKLEAISTELLREDVDLRIAEEAVRLAREAGYAGPELDIVQERIHAIRAYERKRNKSPREVAMRTRKKRVMRKPSARKKKSSSAVTAKKPRKKKAAVTKRVNKKKAPAGARARKKRTKRR
jgi:hypothetical protein